MGTQKKWELKGWVIESFRGLGRGYVSCTFSDPKHACVVPQYDAWIICG